MPSSNDTTVVYQDESQLRFIPPKLRRQAGFRLGDRLELKVSRGAITILAKSSSEANPLLEAFEEARANAKRAGSDRLSMRQINSLVAKSRKAAKSVTAKPME